jgi:ATP-dependent RNA helicase DeaD
MTVENEMVSFLNLELSPPLLKAITDAGYVKPTPVQAAVIPLALAGLDLIVQSQTGTGKTAAFSIPIAEMLEDRPGVVQALVLTPTRELAGQVAREFERLGCNERNIDVVPVYGGASMEKQIKGLQTAQIIVATPGRMLDLLRRKATHLRDLSVFVLDEADEMLSMGFEKELNAICEFLPEERQSVLFSATVTEDIKHIAAGLLSYPEFLSFSSDTLAAEEVDHYYYMITGVGRLQDLNRLLLAEDPKSALIFCNTRDGSFQVANSLKREGYDAAVLNGELTQSEREKVMGRMKAGKLRFLVATDIAARGIDISFLPCVINYILPESPESYIHRTGRTGRAGREGIAVSLISPREIGVFYQLRRAYKLDLTARNLPSDEELRVLRERNALEGILEGLDADEELDYGRYLAFADSFPTLPDHRARLAKLIAHFVNTRSKSEEPAVEEEVQASAPKATDGKRSRSRKPTMSEIEVNVGSDRFESPDSLFEMLADLSGMERTDFGKAELFDDHSTVEVRSDLADDIVAAIDQASVDNYTLVVTR